MIETKDIMLRDLRMSDIPKRTEWETVETEWQLWDGPWEFEGLAGAEKRKNVERRIRAMQTQAAHVWRDDERRKSLQIEVRGEAPRLIGWVASYYLTEHFVFTKEITDRCAVGIDIPDQSARGNGYSYQALRLFIDYLLEHGEKDIYLQTWSGNVRMIHIAERMGFEECLRKTAIRMVRGKKYDGLTFRLNMQKYAEFICNYFVNES